MEPCPNELINNGECRQITDKQHLAKYKHFSTIVNGKVLLVYGKPMCKHCIHGPNQCPQKRVPMHRHSFSHK